MFPSSTNQDIGIDVVAVRGGDGRHVAIQCKSWRLENGMPAAIQKSELAWGRGGTRVANQTSSDLGLLVNECRGLVLVENKFTEHSFYKCSAWKHKGSSRRLGNPDPTDAIT